MHVRRATPDDAAEVARLGALMFESMGLTVDEDWRARAEVRLRDGFEHGDVAAFVVDGPEGGLVANAAVTVAQRLPGPRNRTGRAGYVQYVCTEVAWRGKGLGRAVMTAVVDWCRSQDAGVVELHATADGEPLYRSMGFGEGPNPGLRLAL